MPEKSSRTDLVGLTRALGAADTVDGTMAFFAADAVWDSSRMGFEIHEGRDAIRRSFEEWFQIFSEPSHRDEEIVEMGRGVVYLAACLGTESGTSAANQSLSRSFGYVITWMDGKISRVTVYPDADDARAAAECLAQERG
jgi:ketosteroid isomerase-like protein